MADETDGDWVQANTPRDESAEDWHDEDTEYGHTVEPEEWDDYASEQSVPVATPRPRPTVPEDNADQEQDSALASPSTAEEHDSLVTPDGDDQGVAHAPTAEMHDDAPDAAPGDDVPGDQVHEDQAVVDEERQDDSHPGMAAGVGAGALAGGAMASHDHESVEDEQPYADESQHQDEALDQRDQEDLAAEQPAEDPEATQVYEPVPDHDETVADDSTHNVEQDDHTESYGDDSDDDHTAVYAGGAAAAGAAGGAALYRDDNERTEDTQVIDQGHDDQGYPEVDEQEAEERRLQEQLAAEREARQQRLGVVATSEENAHRETVAKPKRTTDKFFGASGLFILRLITAAVLGVTGYQVLTSINASTEVLQGTMIPEPRLATWIIGFTLGAMAILLVLGLLQRFVGLLLVVYGVGMLVFLRWGTFNPFREGFEGFYGDKELLLAGIGLLLLFVGGGGWGIDGAFRRSRAKAKAERQA